MKQVDIGGFVLVKVPKSSYTHVISNGMLYYVWMETAHGISLPPGDYQIVGLAKDLTPDQWCEIFGTEYDAHCFMEQNKLLHETTLIIKKTV